MFQILMAAGWSLIGWAFRGVVVKFFLFFALFWVTSEMTAYVLTKINVLPFGTLPAMIADMPAGMLWAANLIRLDVGLPALMSAHLVAFAIRRLPIIG